MREGLLKRDPAVIAEALRLVADSKTTSGWHILEGRSAPDALFEGPTFVVVIEGKRTEAKATTHTTWMPFRNQMLRHMDAAQASFPEHQVLGLMVAEDVAEDGISPAPKWITASKATVTKDSLDRSLPHLTVERRQQLASGFLGITTWRQVCTTFGLPWPPVAV